MADRRKERNEISLRLDGPPKSQWYHGHIDRKTAEKILTDSKRGGGCFLVRESTSDTGHYVISYLGNTDFSHFRISAVCGEFYIGGRQFSELSDLVAYYTNYSELLSGEKLVHPVPPEREVLDTRYVRSILPYTNPEQDTDELGFERDEIFSVSNDLGDGWLWVVNEKTRQSGILYQDFVKDIKHEGDENVESLPYFHHLITQTEIKELLMKGGESSYLVSPEDNANFILYLLYNKTIRRFKIHKHARGYLLGNRYYNSIQQIIERYKHSEILSGVTLKTPIERTDTKSNGQHHATANSIMPLMRQSSGLDILTRIGNQLLLQGELFVRKSKKLTKIMYCILKSDGQLLMTENRRRTKPDVLLDLNHMCMYPAHVSLLKPLPQLKQNTNLDYSVYGERRLGLQIVSASGTAYYLSTINNRAHKDWNQAMRKFCKNCKSAQPNPSLKQHSTLQIGITEVKNLPDRYTDCQIACQVTATDNTGSYIISKTQFKDGSQPIFEEQFSLEGIADNLTSCTVSVLYKNKKSTTSKEAEIFSYTHNLVSNDTSSLTLNDSLSKTIESGDIWKTLTPLSGAPPTSSPVTVRLTLKYSLDLILSLNEYNDLRQVLINRDGQTVIALASLCEDNAPSRAKLALSLLKIFRRENLHITLLKSLNAVEVAKEEDPSTLFRGNILATALMDQYMKAVSGPFVKSALSSTVNKITDVNFTLHKELSNGLKEPGVINEQKTSLVDILTESLNQIIKSKNHCPGVLRHICHSLQKNVSGKWPDSEIIKPRVVSAFIFLRLLCPALIQPKSFNLCTDSPPPEVQNTLKSIARCLNDLANLNKIGNKDCHTEGIGPFLIENKHKMITFLNELSDYATQPDVTSSSQTYVDQPDTDDFELARVYASIYNMCLTHITTLQERSKSQPALKKLVSAILSIKRLTTDKYHSAVS